MKRIANPELDRHIIEHLATKYKLRQKRSGIHLSTLVYCLTKSYLDSVNPIEPTDEEIMLFALGLGLQDVVTPGDAQTPVYEYEGVTFSPDFFIPSGEGLCELKTTRMSSKKHLENLPETWVEYIMGGCHIRDVRVYQLSTLFMMGNYAPPFPSLYSETLKFTETELEENWKRLMLRKDVYVEALETQKAPRPYGYCKEWECKNCRHNLVCSALVSGNAEFVG